MSVENGKSQPDVMTDGWVNRVGGLTRFIVFVPVLGLAASAVALVVIGAIETVRVMRFAFLPSESGGATMKETLVAFIELTDLFLLAVVIYIIALGLFELFIDSNLKLPSWLQFHDLDDLKYRLVGVVVVVLSVLFLGRAIQTTSAQDLFWMGAGSAAVIAALAFFLKGSHSKQ